jgi:hypothetical protein
MKGKENIISIINIYIEKGLREIKITDAITNEKNTAVLWYSYF